MGIFFRLHLCKASRVRFGGIFVSRIFVLAYRPHEPNVGFGVWSEGSEDTGFYLSGRTFSCLRQPGGGGPSLIAIARACGKKRAGGGVRVLDPVFYITASTTHSSTADPAPQPLNRACFFFLAVPGLEALVNPQFWCNTSDRPTKAVGGFRFRAH